MLDTLSIDISMVFRYCICVFKLSWKQNKSRKKVVYKYNNVMVTMHKGIP